MVREPLYELVNKVRARLSAFRVVRMLLSGLLGGSVAGGAVLLTSRLWPMLHAKGWMATLVGVGLILGAAAGLWRRASIRDAARVMDKAHTEDAISTALDGLSREAESASPIVRLQREDATVAARKYVSALPRNLPWPAWRRWRALVAGSVASWLVIAALLLIPNPMDDKAQALSEAKAALEELEREADELEKSLAEKDLPEDAKEELLKPLEQLREELREAGLDSEAALEELAETMKELQRVAEEAKAAAERLEEAAKGMSESPQLQQLAESLRDRDADAMSRAIDELRAQLHELSPAEREALAEAMERLAAKQPQENAAAAELAAALEQAAQQARDAGDGAAEGEAAAEEGAADGLAALEDALARGLSQGELEALARAMSGQLGASGAQLAERLAAQGGAVPPAWASAAAGGASGSGSEGGAGTGAGGESSGGSDSGDSQGEGQGSSGENGTGGGQGSGGDAGAGSGSSSGSGQGSGTGGGSGTGAGTGGGAGLGAGDRNLVTTPRDMAGSGDVHQDGGPSTGGDVQSGGQSPMIDGMTRPYEEVYGEYAAEAKESLGRSQLPASMQDKVKRYFDEIQPDR